MVQMIHVQTIGHDFPAQFVALLKQAGVAHCDGRIDSHSGRNAMLLKRFHDSVNAHPIAVVTQGVMAEIWISCLHGARWFEGHTCHVQRKPL